MLRVKVRFNDLPTPRTTLTALAAVCALGLSLAGAPTAHAASYSVEDSFDEGASSLGVAVDQTSNDVYVDNFSINAMKRFSSAGALEAPSFASGEALFGVAVDPLNENVYSYNGATQEIETYELSGTKVDSFKVPGSAAIVEIAGGPNGDVYYPDKEANTVLKFSPTGTLEATLKGEAPVGAFSAPQGVAVDAAGNVYVADSGDGRTVRIEAGTGAQSVIDTGGTQDVAVDPVSGDVFALDLNSEGNCEPLSAPCYRVRAYHSGETTPFAEFGAGTIHNEGPPNHIAVDHATSRVYVSDFEHEVWIFAPGTPPRVAYPTPSVTGVSASEATMEGEVNPEGNETSCHFEYGVSEAYEHSVPCQPELVGEGTKFKAKSVTISGLEANTEYHFRLVATTATGTTVHGADQTFTTSQAPPLVLAGSMLASDVTQNDVVFNATINPQHLDTRYYFNYGLHPFEDSESGCTPLGAVPYATAPATPVDIGTAHSISEEAAGLGVALDLDSESVVLHPGMESRVLQPNTAYRFQIVAENGAGVTCEPEATFITLPPDPLATTGAAAAVTQTTASLVGAVTPGSVGPNSDTTWRFQYGTDTTYTGGSVPATPGDAGMGASPVAVSTALEGLAPNTAYHYRLLASNANDDPAADPAVAPQIADGADRTFTTLPAEPTLDQPLGLTEMGVTLTGSVSPGGHDLHYSFEYGATSGYGQRTPLTDAGEGGGPASVSAPLTGLAPGTYHYRLVAIGPGGETASPDATFTLYTPMPEQASNPFTVGQSTPAPFTTVPLLRTPTFPPPPTETTVPTTKLLTKAQKLIKALDACKKLRGSKRKACEKSARRRYASKPKPKIKK